jgi:glycerophosphoryl diester phosphodiesterase
MKKFSPLVVNVAASTVLALMMAGCSSAGGPHAVQPGTRVNLMRTVAPPAIIAHRGGPLLNPEESLEAYRAAADSGFPLEMDIRPLKDGALVPSHDRTVDRTMVGATGKLTSLTSQEWDALNVRAVGRGAMGTPTTWNELLETFGGKVLLVPQIDESGDVLNGFIQSIKRRNLQDAVVVQSWGLETSKTVATAGLHALQLVVKNQEIEPGELAVDGIEYVGVSANVDKSYVEELKARGIKVWVYTVNSVSQAEKQYAKGADGVFTDDPWLLQSSPFASATSTTG